MAFGKVFEQKQGRTMAKIGGETAPVNMNDGWILFGDVGKF